MKYVFFDIECACVYKCVAKICAFGYVVTDENYNVLAKEDILVNPKGKFHLTDRKGGQGIVLPYEYSEFTSRPLFPKEYPKIKALLEDKDAIVLGHATLNDVNYLNLETRRYRLPSFRFEYLDTQFFYMNVVGDYAHQIGLGGMAEKLNVDFVPHRAADDAYATMRVCEALCKRENTDVKGLVERYKIRAGKLNNYKIRVPDSAGLQNYYRERERIRAKRAKAREEFYRFVNKHNNRKRKEQGGAYDGKVFCFAKEIENDVPCSVKLLGAIYASGGKYTSHPQECDVYVAHETGGVRYDHAVDSGAVFMPFTEIVASLDGMQ